jgi:4-hydroxy-3-methylbut-2-enyl diphosphate reductase
MGQRGNSTVMAAMRLESLALGGRVVRTGMGHHHAQTVAARVAAELDPGAPVVLAGISGGLDPSLAPGDIVVATTVQDPDGAVYELSRVDASDIAAELRRDGLTVHLGPIVSSTTIVHGERRTALAQSGALAVDMESAWVARALGAHRLVVVRVVADTAGHFVRGLVKGLAALRHVRASIDRWPGAPTGQREPEHDSTE